MEQALLWIIAGIAILDFAFEKILDYLNLTHLKEDLPKDLDGLVDPEKYSRSQQYEKAKTSFSFISASFSLFLILIMLIGGGFGMLDAWVRSITDQIYVQNLLFFGILGLAGDLLMTPFQLYSTFVLEARFGFNKTTPLLFVTDKLKSGLLGMIIGGLVLSFLLWTWTTTGQWFSLIVLCGLGGFMVFMTMFYSRLLVPLFNKQRPLEAGALKEAIEQFASKVGFSLANIYVIDGSKRSTKANAYFSGLGRKKRIVLYDTLIHDLTTDEIVAVLAHEIGHYKKHHIIKGLMMSLVQTGVMVCLLSLAVGRPELSFALGAQQSSFYMGLTAFALLFSPVSFFTGIISNMVSRKYEYEADRYANGHFDGQKLIDALIKLSVVNLSNLTPHPAYVFFHYSHPSLLQRKAALEAANR